MISIIMPAKIDNSSKLDWFNEAVDSVLRQSFKEWELIIMDDCSPAPPVPPADERIRYFRLTENSGPALARNTGAALAQYDAILPLDADDKLADNALEIMFEEWQKDKSKIVYGDLQRIENINGSWELSKPINLPSYSFELSLKFSGIMPVTSLHSKECHVKAGGWKPGIKEGLEDVEYWIAAGKAGFCGVRIPHVTLIYRRHQSSRSYNLRMVNKQETAMRNNIRSLHQDVYSGRYPMGCCGGGGKASFVPPKTVANTSFARVSTLDQFGTNEKVWVQYTGKRNASFGVVGSYTNVAYTIDGPGHKLEVHVNDLPKFRRSGRGQDFSIGVSAPNGTKPEEKKKTIEETMFKADAPQLAQVERLDRRALQRG